MLCAACNKESNNRRVCPYCFTPYPPEGAQSRQSTATGRASVSMSAKTGKQAAGLSLGPLDPVRDWFTRQSPTVRWSATGIVVVGLLWSFTGGEATPTTRVVTAPAGVDAPVMTREEAAAIIKRTRESALVEEQADEVSVSYPAATFPVQPEGQVMLAMQFARADEVVNGRKRRIFFHLPSGRMFAQSDGVTGLTVVK
jgi:hypothetical protein